MTPHTRTPVLLRVAASLVPLSFLAASLVASLAWTGEPAAAAALPTPYKPDPGPFTVDVLRYDWRDESRKRPVPVQIYLPKEAPGKLPVVVFSHGLGGTREGYGYLGRHWASHGYISVHVQHEGSDDAVWKGSAQPKASLQRAVLDPKNALDRPKDVSFALDQLQRLSQVPGPLSGRVDLDRAGIAGHSFGAWTTLALAGQSLGLPRRPLSLAEPRFKAAIAMSAPPARERQRDTAYAAIRLPILHMTGTLDDSPIGETTAAERRIPFDRIIGVDQLLVTFEGGDHMVFSGRGKLPGGRQDALFQRLILESTTAFWDAYLKDDPAAKAWLVAGGFAAILGEYGKLETKKRSGASAATPGNPAPR